MNYKEHLDYANANKDFYLGKALIACELYYQCEYNLTEELFERICSYAYNYYLDSKASAYEIVKAILFVAENHKDTLGEYFGNLYAYDKEIENQVVYGE